MLVDETGLFLSQRKLPQLTQFKTSIQGDQLVINYKDKELSLELNCPDSLDESITVWKDSFKARSMSSYLSQWFSEHLEKQVRLVRYNPMTPRSRRHKSVDFTASFADGYPVLITNEHSLTELNELLPQFVPMNRFRPNIVVNSLAAWAELNSESIEIAGQKSVVGKPCERCLVTTIDQDTGQIDSSEPLRTLAKLGNGRAVFGMNFALPAKLEVAVGQEIKWL